jgi:glycosyltransferase involved in cell wall biosynthesis
MPLLAVAGATGGFRARELLPGSRSVGAARARMPALTRVLHIITRFAQGGSERRLLDTIDAVDAHHQVIVGGETPPDQLERLADRAEVLHCDPLQRSVAPAADLRALTDLRRRVRTLRPEVVHTHQSKAGLLGRVAARLAGVPIVYHSASMASFGPGYPRGESLAFALAERVTAPAVTRYLVVGQDLADRLTGNGISPRRLRIIRSGLDLTAFVPPTAAERAVLRRRFGVPEGSLVVCYVGSLDERKRVLSLPRILARAQQRLDRPLVLLVAGDGPQRDALGAAFGPTASVRLLGHVGDPHEVIRAADALVLPSVAEGVPQVLVQAVSCAVPFAAYEGVDGVRELARLGGRHATAPIEDDEALADGLVALLDGRATDATPSFDRAVLRQWSPAEVRARYQAVYAEDLAAVRSSGRRVSARRAP